MAAKPFPSRTILWLILIAALAAFALAYASPALMRITGIDYGIFQYVGKGILSGEMPYRDLYDHKPPAVFYFNAAGLALGGGTRWGIWAVELVSLVLAGAICAWYLRRHFGGLPAALATAAFLLNLTFFHHGGNLTEEYALPLQFGALLLLSLWDESKRPRWCAFLVGACVAGAAALKQPLGAIAIGIAVYLLVGPLRERGPRRILASAGWAAAGFAGVWAGWFAAFALRGVFPEFWESAFAYNFALSGIPVDRRLAALLQALLTLWNAAPYFMLGLVCWLAALGHLILTDRAVQNVIGGRAWGWVSLLVGALALYNGVFRRGLTPYPLADLGARQAAEIVIGIALVALAVAWLRSALPGKLSARLLDPGQEGSGLLRLPLLVAVVDLPVQLVMISLSGNNFDHYFMAALPSLTVLCAFFFWRLSSIPGRVPAAIWAVILSLPILLTGAVATAEKIRVSEDRYTRAIAQYVSTNTRPGEGIFYWGNLAPVYLESDRRSPSRFFFTDPLFLDGYTDRRHTDIFLRELQAAPPALIVSGANAERPLLYSADPANCRALAVMDTAVSLAQVQYEDAEVFLPDGMPEVYAWICANYTAEEVQLAGEEGWVKTVYRYTPGR